MAVSSNLGKNKILKILNNHFIDIPERELCPSNPCEIILPVKKTYFIKRDKKMTLISMVSLLPQISMKNLTMAYLLENMLGKGIGSKIWTIRTNHKFDLGIAPEFELKISSKVLFIRVVPVIKTKNDRVTKAMAVLSELLNELHEKGINPDEFIQAKNYAKSYILRSNETRENRITNMLIFEASGISYEFLSNFSHTIDKISLEEFNNYVKKILNPENQIKIIIGPKRIKMK